MATVQPVTTLNIDGNTLQVADLSQRVQQLVAVYNDWNQKNADAQNELMLVQAALNDLSRQIIVQIKADAEAAAAAANDTATTAPATDSPQPAATTSTDVVPAVPTAKE